MNTYCAASDCGKELPERPVGATGPPKRYCNNSCRARECARRDPERAERWYQASLAKNRAARVPRIFVCPYCQEEFDARRKDAKHCGAPACKRQYHARRMVYYNGRRRAMIRQARVGPPFMATDIYNRDGWICQICDERVEPQLKFPDPGSASMDHKIPIRRGGEHSEGNCRLAHLKCNQEKGYRVV